MVWGLEGEGIQLIRVLVKVFQVLSSCLLGFMPAYKCEGFQLAGCMSKATGVDWKVNISCHMHPPGNILHLQNQIALTTAVITLLHLRKANHRDWSLVCNLNGIPRTENYLQLSPTTYNFNKLIFEDITVLNVLDKPTL